MFKTVFCLLFITIIVIAQKGGRQDSSEEVNISSDKNSNNRQNQGFGGFGSQGSNRFSNGNNRRFGGAQNGFGSQFGSNFPQQGSQFGSQLGIQQKGQRGFGYGNRQNGENSRIPQYGSNQFSNFGFGSNNGNSGSFQ